MCKKFLKVGKKISCIIGIWCDLFWNIFNYNFMNKYEIEKFDLN